MVKLHEIIQEAAQARALEMLGKERLGSCPAAADAIENDFKAGAEWIVSQVMGLQNQFPMTAIVTIQSDPNDTNKSLISLKTAGLELIDLIDVLHQFMQASLDRNQIDMKIVLMPRDEAARREAFQKSIKVVKESTKLKLD